MEDYSGLETDGKVKVDQKKTGDYYRLLMDTVGRSTTQEVGKEKKKTQEDQSEDLADDADDVKSWSTGYTNDQFD